jgi:hypothetical protein
MILFITGFINHDPWIMNLETIKSEQFIKHASKIWWDNWKIEKYKYSAIGYGGILRKTK